MINFAKSAQSAKSALQSINNVLRPFGMAVVVAVSVVPFASVAEATERDPFLCEGLGHEFSGIIRVVEGGTATQHTSVGSAEDQIDGRDFVEPSSRQGTSLELKKDRGSCLSSTVAVLEDGEPDDDQPAGGGDSTATSTSNSDATAAAEAYVEANPEATASQVSSHLQSIGFESDIANDVANTVTNNNDSNAQVDNSGNTEIDTSSNDTHIDVDPVDTVQLQEFNGNPTFRSVIRVGELETLVEAPANVDGGFCFGGSLFFGDDADSGSVTFGSGVDVDGVSGEQGMSILDPALRVQSAVADELENGFNPLDFIVRPAAADNRTTVIQGQSQFQNSDKESVTDFAF